MFWALCCVLFSGPKDTLTHPRFVFHLLQTDAACCEQVYQKFSNSKQLSQRAYAAAAQMSMAEHTFNPYLKLRYFNTGKALLESLIQQHPQNAELHYIRYVIQKHAPGLLGYNGQIEADRALLLKALPYLKQNDLFLYNRCRSIL